MSANLLKKAYSRLNSKKSVQNEYKNCSKILISVFLCPFVIQLS